MRTGTRGTGGTTLTRTLRTRSGTLARASSPLSRFEFPPSVISNRQWLARLENAVTRGKQTPEANSNRHIRDACSVQTSASISPRRRLSPFSVFTFPSSVAARRSSAISNRERRWTLAAPLSQTIHALRATNAPRLCPAAQRTIYMRSKLASGRLTWKRVSPGLEVN